MICRLSLQKKVFNFFSTHNLQTLTIYTFSIYKYSLKECKILALYCASIPISFLVLPPSPSGRLRSGVSCETWTFMVAGTDALGMFHLFHKRTDVMAPLLSIVFCRLVRPISVLACWRQGNITPFVLLGPMHKGELLGQPVCLTNTPKLTPSEPY